MWSAARVRALRERILQLQIRLLRLLLCPILRWPREQPTELEWIASACTCS